MNHQITREQRERWDRICAGVRDRMTAFVSKVVTPISLSHTFGRGEAWATGNYVRFRDVPYLLTNAHVVEDALGFGLGHLPGPTDDYIRCGNPFPVDGWPIDVALMRLDSEPTGVNRDVLPSSQIGYLFSTATHELMFWIGFPGSKAMRHEPITDLNRRYSWMGGALETEGIPMLVQQPVDPLPPRPGIDAERHVALHYPAKATRIVGQPPVDVPNPKGMSGSLLWDTKFVACRQSGDEWTPEKAEVCGLVWAALSNPEVVVATKIEYVRPVLLHFLREEAAYFHWLDRGRPQSDDLTDWLWAEQNVPNLE